MGQRQPILKTATQSLLVALATLTVIPIRLRVLPASTIVARSRFWYPVVGLLLGGLLGGWTLLITRLNAPLLGAFLVLLAWVVVTGGLHLDGLCDLCDGLLGGRTVEDRLRIMKDPHLGTFGLIGGVLLLLGKFTLVEEVLVRARDQAPWLIAAALVVARCLTLGLAAAAPYPRPEGTGKALIEATRWWEAVPVAAAGLVVALWALADVPAGLAIFGATLVAMALLRWLCQRRLGGITGDCLGAGVEIAEVIFLLGSVLWIVLQNSQATSG